MQTCTDKMQKVFLLYSTVVVGILLVLTLKESFLCPGIVPGGLGFLLAAVPGGFVVPKKPPQAFQAVRVFPRALTLTCMFSSSADHRAG